MWQEVSPNLEGLGEGGGQLAWLGPVPVCARPECPRYGGGKGNTKDMPGLYHRLCSHSWDRTPPFCPFPSPLLHLLSPHPVHSPSPGHGRLR